MKKIRVAIADDNSFLIKVIEDKLSFFEEIQVKIKASNGREMFEKICISPKVDLILMDIEMPEMNGIEATFQIKQKFPQIKIIMLTVFDNDEHIFNAIKAGADGYLLKEVAADVLHKGMVDTINGGAAMHPSIALKTLRLLRNPVAFDQHMDKEQIKLSVREIEVLEHLSKGLNYHQIAENLSVSPATIRKHIEHIYNKLQVHNKLEAVQKAKSRNII
jgi:DNA-binding NarL/FixJ family response regulator